MSVSDDDSTSSIELDDPIVAFRRPTRYTNIDFREKFALKAEDILLVRRLSTGIEKQLDLNESALLYSILSHEPNYSYNWYNDGGTNSSCSSNSIFDSISSNSSNSTMSTNSDSSDSFSSSSCSSNNIRISFDEMIGREFAIPTMPTFDEMMMGKEFSIPTMPTFDEILNDSFSISSRIDDYLPTMPTFDEMMNDSNERRRETKKKRRRQFNGTCENRKKKQKTNMFLSSMNLNMSIIEHEKLVDTLIEFTAIRESEWDAVPRSILSPKRNRTIDELGTDCYHYTRFSSSELKLIRDHLFGKFPTNSYTWCENRYTFEETLIIAMHYMANGTKFIEMKEIYGGNWTRFSHMTNFFAKFLFHKYYHRLCGRSLEYWAEKTDQFRKAIYDYVVHDEDGVQDIDIDLENFRIFGWIDCLHHIMCQLASGPCNEDDDRYENRYELQRAYYTKYIKSWGMKTQAVGLPNGMYGSVFFASLAQNDKGVVNMSGIEEELERVLAPYKLHENTVFPALYGDQIYDISSVIVQSHGINDDLTFRLNAARIDIEHLFGNTGNMWKRKYVKHTWKLMKMKVNVREHLFALFFVSNILTCLRGNKTSTKYGFTREDLDLYLNVSLEHSYDGDDAHEVMMELLHTQIDY